MTLSLASTGPRRPASRFYHLDGAFSAIPTFGLRDSNNAAGAATAEKESRTSHETGRSSGSGSHTTSSTGKAPAFGSSNALLATGSPSTKDAAKRRKPKSNISKTNSSFISRFVPHEQLNKRLQAADAAGTPGAATNGTDSNAGKDNGTNGGAGGGGLFAFTNVGRAFLWLDLAAPALVKADVLTKILFAKAHLLCHDINAVTKAPGHLDVVAGSSAADIIWYEPFSQRYNRINKNGVINPSPVSCVKWIPGSETLFLAAHMDGTLIVYDKEREDAAFVPDDASAGPASGSTPYPEATASLHVQKSVNSKNQKGNPVALWKLSNQRINAVAFAPDARHLAVASEDGCLRLIDYLQERLLDVFTSYYGGLTCAAWSPDGRYVLTGGQDDLVAVWSRAERTLVARCPGHRSWVSAVAFDPWRCEDANYRFGSAGEDGRLLLWDFNVHMLHRPRASVAAAVAARRQSAQYRDSVSSQPPPSHPAVARARAESLLVPARLRSNSSLTTGSTEGDDSVEHAVESRTRTAELPPVMARRVDEHPLSWLGFQEDCIITACASGHIRTWDRPKEATVNGSRTTVSAATSGL